jgi:DNA modification methylase
MKVDVIRGDCRDILKTLADQSVNCCVTSPPYFGLRDYGHSNQIGLEKTPIEFVAELVLVFREIFRILKDDGTLWLNLGDSYAGSGKGQYPDGANDPKNPKTKGMKVDIQKPSSIGLKAKDLIGIPWRVAFALQADGWYLRRDIIWHKPNPMPESVTDRCTSAYEYIFHFSKSPKYYYDADAIAEDAIYSGLTGQNASGYKDAKLFAGKYPDKQRGHGRRHAGFNDRWDAMSKKEQCSGKRNKRSVWTIATKPFKKAHFATFPPDLILPCILAGCPEGGTVIDPFGGAGTTGLVADRNGRNAILIELNESYASMARNRINDDAPMFSHNAMASQWGAIKQENE